VAQVDDQWNKNGWDGLHKTSIADQVGKLCSPMLANVFRVIGFEVAIVGLVESNQDGQVFIDGQGTSPLALFQPTGEQVTVPVGYKCFAKIIDSTEDFE